MADEQTSEHGRRGDEERARHIAAFLMKHIRAVVLVMGIMFLAGGGAAGVWGYVLIRDGKASESWPSVEGAIRQSRVRQRTVSRSGRHEVMYEADVVFDYAVAGRTQSSDRVFFGQVAASNRGYAEDIVDRYPPGKHVDVHYDPGDPAKAVLEPGTRALSYLPLGIGAAIAAFGAFLTAGMTVALVRGRKRRGRGT